MRPVRRLAKGMLRLAGLMERAENRGAAGQLVIWMLLPVASLLILIADAVLRRAGEEG